MTSDKPVSEARQQLGYALGEKRVSLGSLTREEFIEFMRSTLDEVDLRELRGFKPFKDLLARRPGSFSTGRREDPTECVDVSEATKIKTSVSGLDFSTHATQIGRGSFSHVATYRRHESGEETTDRDVFVSWEGGGYVYKICESFFALRRPNDHSSTSDNLLLVQYEYVKVPHEDRMQVVSIKVRQFSIVELYKFPSNARDVIWEFSSLVSRTLDELQSKMERFRDLHIRMDRIGRSTKE